MLDLDGGGFHGEFRKIQPSWHAADWTLSAEQNHSGCVT